MNSENISLRKALKQMCDHPIKAFAYLRDRRILNSYNLPDPFFVKQGLLSTKESRWMHPELGLQYSTKTMVTEKGRRWLYERLREAPKTLGLGTVRPPQQGTPAPGVKQSSTQRMAKACAGTHASHSCETAK